MKTTLNLLSLALAAALSGGVAVAAHGGGGGGGDKPLCTGNEPARRGAAYAPKESLFAILDAFAAATAQYAEDHPEAAEYAAVSARISGSSCFADSDCATGDDAQYRSSCNRYVWEGTNGRCEVYPVVAIATPPALPRFACSDVVCPDSFQCEVEESTGAVGCVEQRLCRDPR